MIDKAIALETIVEKLCKLPEGHSIVLRSYKRNRSLLFFRDNNDEILIIEDGYEKKKYVLFIAEVHRMLKNLIKNNLCFVRS